MFLNYVLKNSSWRKGLLKQRELFLAGATKKYPWYCPVYGCGVIGCHDHREGEETRDHNSTPNDDFHTRFHAIINKLIGASFTYYLLMSFTYKPSAAFGHDYNNYEWDEWEYYADEHAENSPSKAKYFPSGN